MLTKSLFMAGRQCRKLLWWSAHEPDAQELVPDPGTRDLFDQSREVELAARRLFAEGSARFQASFTADEVQVRVDALQDLPGGGLSLIEVKSSTSLKEEHLPDVAVQTHVLRRCGVDLRRIEVMHLSKDFRHPDQGALFVREDVTRAVEALLPEIPGLITEQLAALRGERPQVAIGRHCADPRECPFRERCWPQDRFHVTRLYRGRDKGLELMRRGVELMKDIPRGEKLSDIQQRQRSSSERGALVVAPTLAAALEPFAGRLGYLDFETISRAIPVWPGTRPWQQTVVQFSYHEDRPGGGQTHVGWLAEGPQDPREALARAMLEATANSERIVMYSGFERARIGDLEEALPHLGSELATLKAKLVDLLPVMQHHVYHPDFKGSFSLKFALSPLVPELTYDDLMIREGMTASAEIWRLLFVAHRIPPDRRDALRRDLLAYCERDTLAMVRLLEALRVLASTPSK